MYGGHQALHVKHTLLDGLEVLVTCTLCITLVIVVFSSAFDSSVYWDVGQHLPHVQFLPLRRLTTAEG